VVLDALEKGEREGAGKQKALIDDLPLFSVSATPPPAPARSKPSPLEEMLEAIHPDDLTPREALDALYRLKEATRD
jgi:DNA mismatch repair protein MutS